MIVCWDFPPHDAIGGRRWAKIAKSLIKLGYTVSVITSEVNLSKKKLAWISEKEFEKIHLYYLSNHLLAKWLVDYHSPFKFLKIRAAQFLLSTFFKGTIFDRAIGIENRFSRLATGIIQKREIGMVFVTGAPFNLVYYTSKLKNTFPELKIVSDYRDPWINAQNYGMKNLSPAKMKDEQAKQNYVFEHADYVTAPNVFLLQEIKDTYTGTKEIISKFVELPHAFDPDDVVQVLNTSKDSKKIKIVYGGTLYLGIDRYLELINRMVMYMKTSFKDKQLEIVFYTNESDKFAFFSENADCVKFSKAVGDKIFEEIATADFILILLSEHNKNYVTSKYLEFLPYKKPYLYVGPEGFVSAKIEQEGFGYYLREPEDIATILLENDKQPFTESVKNLEQYTFDAITTKLLNTIV